MNIVSYSTVLFCIEIISLFRYSLPYSQFSCPWCGHYITLVRINTHIIYFYSYLYRVATKNHKGDSYSSCSGKLYILLLFSLTFILLVTKHYSTYTLCTAFVSKTVFTLQIPHKIRIKSKIHKRGDEERRKTRKTKSPFCSSKRTICCFGEGIQLNMLTLIQVSAILSGNQSGIKLANRLGLCSRSCLPVWAEAASTCWVFTSNSFVLNPILSFFVVDSSRKEIVAGATATFLAFQLRNTKVVLIAVFRVSCICCYYCY